MRHHTHDEQRERIAEMLRDGDIWGLVDFIHDRDTLERFEKSQAEDNKREIQTRKGNA